MWKCKWSTYFGLSCQNVKSGRPADKVSSRNCSTKIGIKLWQWQKVKCSFLNKQEKKCKPHPLLAVSPQETLNWQIKGTLCQAVNQTGCYKRSRPKRGRVNDRQQLDEAFCSRYRQTPVRFSLVILHGSFYRASKTWYDTCRHCMESTANNKWTKAFCSRYRQTPLRPGCNIFSLVMVQASRLFPGHLQKKGD